MIRASLAPLAVGLAAILGGGCGRSDAEAAAVVAAAEAFLAEQREGAWPAAFARLHVNLQRDCRSPEGLHVAVVTGLGPPRAWTIGRPTVRRYTAALAVSATRRDGVAVPIDIALDRIGTRWAITGWRETTRSLCR